MFAELSGQWRAGFGGGYAMDYTALFMRMDRLRLDDADWEQMFADVRTLEAAALDAMKTARA